MMTSEVEKRPRFVTGGTGVNGLINSNGVSFQSNQYKELAPVLSRFCNGLWYGLAPSHSGDSRTTPTGGSLVLLKPG